MKNAIVTESNFRIKKESMNMHDIYYVPEKVSIDGYVFHRGIELSEDELSYALKAGKDVAFLPTTPDAIISFCNELLSQYEELLFIPISADFLLINNLKKHIESMCPRRIHILEVKESKRFHFLPSIILEANLLLREGQSPHDIISMLGR